MENYNNMKQIREIYGATQDEIAKMVNVNRATISQWETGAAKASSANLEKLSIFYGIGPECFYELPEIDDVRKEMLINSAKKAQEIKEKSEKKRDKALVFRLIRMFLDYSREVKHSLLFPYYQECLQAR